MSRSSSANRHSKNPFRHNHSRLQLEMLEDRSMPSCTSISGFVFHDANNNGLFDQGETPIANSVIELHDANNDVVGTATTDAQGHYEFSTDQLHPGEEKTLTKTVTFPASKPGFQLDGQLDQFDPSLGQLVSVEIKH